MCAYGLMQAYRLKHCKVCVTIDESLNLNFLWTSSGHVLQCGLYDGFLLQKNDKQWKCCYTRPGKGFVQIRALEELLLYKLSVKCKFLSSTDSFGSTNFLYDQVTLSPWPLHATHPYILFSASLCSIFIQLFTHIALFIYVSRQEVW